MHVAIIMDGNGRWAVSRGMPRQAGHRAGVTAVRRTVEAAPRFGISVLSLFAFSADNWTRPRSEVRHLFALLRSSLREQSLHCFENGICMKVIGRRDRLPSSLQDAISDAENLTRSGSRLTLRIAVDYSARDSIVDAAGRLGEVPQASRGSFSYLLSQVTHDSGRMRPVDLLIRTGGERRLSDFLLWESAYAELYFTSLGWPDFAEADLEAAVSEYRRRERRFGGLPA